MINWSYSLAFTLSAQTPSICTVNFKVTQFRGDFRNINSEVFVGF